MNKNEVKELLDYMNAVGAHVPRGLSSLNEAMTFAILDLTAYYRFGSQLSSFHKAIAFGKTIPKFTDLKSEECASWMLHDVEHMKYLA